MGAEECERVGARGGDGLKPVNSYNTLSLCLSVCLSRSVFSRTHVGGNTVGVGDRADGGMGTD